MVEGELFADDDGDDPTTYQRCETMLNILEEWKIMCTFAV